MSTAVKKPDAKIYTEEDIIPMGKKHKGKKVGQVVREDPGWIVWAQENVDFMIFAPEVLIKCHDRETIYFPFNLTELKEELMFLQQLERGLDAYGNQGVRQLHGFSDREDIHKHLTYQRRLIEYLVEQFTFQETIKINRV